MEVKQGFEYFKLLEEQFWKKLDERTIQHITFHGQLKAEDMLLYGEFGFALIGLKPSVLVEFRDEKVNRLYLETVIDPALVALKEKTLKYQVIKDIQTPESDLNGSVLIYSTTCSIDPLKRVLKGDEKFMEEETMALVLGYPGNLPKSQEEIGTMKSVIYFHRLPHEELVALTSFAIQESEKEKTLDHFKDHFKACKEILGIDLKLLMQ